MRKLDGLVFADPQENFIYSNFSINNSNSNNDHYSNNNSSKKENKKVETILPGGYRLSKVKIVLQENFGGVIGWQLTWSADGGFLFYYYFIFIFNIIIKIIILEVELNKFFF
jgi:hypothetical protein